MQGLGESRTGGAQSGRVAAYAPPPTILCFLDFQTCGTVIAVARRSSNRRAACSLYRYPSLDRPAYSPSRPITVFRPSQSENTVDIGYHHDSAMHLRADRVNCGATLTITIGLRLCKRHQSSLQQWQFSVWLAALKATWNAVWQAQAQALWPQNSLEQTAQAQCLPVLPLAYCATTQGSTAAAKVDNRAHRGRINFGNRRRGYAPAAVLRFGDER